MSIEIIKSKSQVIIKKREHVKKKFEEFEQSLLEAFSGLPISAISRDIKLELLSPDDAIYGHLFYDNGFLKVGYRSTETDLMLALNGLGHERTYNIKPLFECSSKWLVKLSQKNVLDSLIKKLIQELEDFELDASESVSSLENINSAQSEEISNSVENFLHISEYETLLKQWLTAKHNCAIDPSDSITRSSSYLESVLKLILQENSISLPSKQTVDVLLTEVDKIFEFEKLVDNDLKMLIGGVKSIFKGVGNLRTHFGTVHGKLKTDFIISESIAKLVNNIAGSVSIFFLQEHKKKMNGS